jgi:hypothetical protein
MYNGSGGDDDDKWSNETIWESRHKTVDNIKNGQVVRSWTGFAKLKTGPNDEIV